MKTSRAHFPKIKPIAYEGPGSANALAFRHYQPDELIDGKTMSEHMRFSLELLADRCAATSPNHEHPGMQRTGRSWP